MVFSLSNMVIFHLAKCEGCQWTVLCPRLSGTPLQNDLEDRGESWEFMGFYGNYVVDLMWGYMVGF